MDGLGTSYLASDGTFKQISSTNPNTVVVSSSGGDYTTIQAAINSVKNGTNAGKKISVAPGTYYENILLYSGITISNSSENAKVILKELEIPV